MAAIGLAEAARITGKNQSTIHRALKTGRLSFTIGPGGDRQIDPAELERVFSMNGAGAMAHAAKSNFPQAGEIAALQRLLDDRDDTIRDLRARLDASDEERRKLTAMLTDQRSARGWWARLRNK